MRNRSNESNYIERLKKGKEDALNYIIDKYFSVVKGTVLKVLINLNKEELIEECINDIFMSIWQNASKFKGNDEDFKKWLYKISKFKAIDYYRKEIRKKEFAEEKIEYGQTKSSEDEFMISEDRKEFIRLINNLQPVDRDIFIMKFLLGMSSNEIAVKTGLSKSAIDNRIYRSKKVLNKNKNAMCLEVI